VGSGGVRSIHNGDVGGGIDDSVVETGEANNLDTRRFRDRDGGVGVRVGVGGSGVEVIRVGGWMSR
jgi:hypothetical protein